MHRIAVRLALLLGLAVPLASLGTGAAAQEAPGRYHIVQAGPTAMMIDSATGRSWRLVNQNNTMTWEPVEFWTAFKPIHMPPAPGAAALSPDRPGAPPPPPVPPPGPRR